MKTIRNPEGQRPCGQSRFLPLLWESPDEQHPELEDHLSSCESCRQEIESMAADDGFWKKASVLLGETADLKSGEATALDGPQSSVLIQLDPRIERPEFHHVDQNSPSDELIVSHVDERSLLDPPLHPEMLGRIDGFSVEQVIGRGGMGIVYKGFDANLNRPVAIKFLSPHMAAHGVARMRFIRESRAAAAVVHPNVVPIFSVNTSSVRPYLVMAFVPGPSLQKHVQDHGPLPAEDIVRIGQQIARGLAAAHQQGLVHRDIKPANIMLQNDVSRVLITDFGLARAADDAGLTQTGWLAGTPHYMSPEQVKGERVDDRSDLFSLGSVMYFMATGREPFRGDNTFAVLQKIGGTDPATPRSINSDVPQCLNDFICRLLSKNPDDRFGSADSVQGALTDYLAYLQNPTQCQRPKFAKPRGTWPRWKKSLTATGLVAALAMVIAGGAHLFRHSEQSPSDTKSLQPLRGSGVASSEAPNSEKLYVQFAPPVPQVIPPASAQVSKEWFEPRTRWLPFEQFEAERIDVEQRIEVMERSLGVYVAPE